MISKNIIALGVNSFFTDFSTEMILPLLPLFLERFLHANKSEIGLIEGVAEFGVALLIALSGFMSDRMGKRKNLVLLGYALSNLIKPLAFFAQSAGMVALVRFSDRVGKGIRSAPRDALISAFVTPKTTGLVFGFHKMMDSAGAIAGSLFAFFMLWYLGEKESTFRTVFLLSIIPGLLSLVVILFWVEDAPFTPAPLKAFRPSALSKPFYLLVLFQSLFALASMNYAFMILKAEEHETLLALILLLYTLYNGTLSLSAIHIGKFADQYGKPLLLALIYLFFAIATALMNYGGEIGIWLGFAIYGFFAGGFNSLAKAIIADNTPKELKASAYGVYYFSIGVCTLLSLSIGGWLWDTIGSSLLFTISMSIAFILSCALFLVRHSFRE
ncbi:MFS transporter [Sulfurospirillum oryzae]|uniref:MFS transporter n=1 Tax=Sulfurospirillum oryzae TaxID=2976535 RepID=UPI0021E896E9|nr:MFS transporter [Sulfurospirillum oryzae]